MPRFLPDRQAYCCLRSKQRAFTCQQSGTNTGRLNDFYHPFRTSNTSSRRVLSESPLLWFGSLVPAASAFVLILLPHLHCLQQLQTLSPADARLNSRTKKFHPMIPTITPSPDKYPLVFVCSYQCANFLFLSFSLIQRQALLSGLKSAFVDLQLPPRPPLPPLPIHQHCPCSSGVCTR